MPNAVKKKKKKLYGPFLWMGVQLPQGYSHFEEAVYFLPLKALDISSATAQVAPDLLKPLAILSDTTVRRSAVDRDLKQYWKSQKRPHFSR